MALFPARRLSAFDQAQAPIDRLPPLRSGVGVGVRFKLYATRKALAPSPTLHAPSRPALFCGTLVLGILVSLAVMLAVLVAPVSATGIDAARVRSLARQADAVILGTCESSHSRWDESGRFIVSRCRVRAARSFKGAAAETYAVETLGGSVDGTEMAASHGARVRAGESAVLFLRRGRAGSYVVWGGAEGKLPAAVGAGGWRIGHGEGVTVEEFRAKVGGGQ